MVTHDDEVRNSAFSLQALPLLLLGHHRALLFLLRKVERLQFGAKQATSQLLGEGLIMEGLSPHAARCAAVGEAGSESGYVVVFDCFLIILVRFLEAW
jgi:hypothetical protein